MSKNNDYVGRISLQWAGSIFAIIVGALILGMFTFWKDSVLEDQTHDEKIDDIILKNIEDMKGLRELHDKDIYYLKDDIDEIKNNQKIIMADIKTLLKKE